MIMELIEAIDRNNQKFVVMMATQKAGMVIHSDGKEYQPGYYSNAWDFNEQQLFQGNINLYNKESDYDFWINKGGWYGQNKKKDYKKRV